MEGRGSGLAMYDQNESIINSSKKTIDVNGQTEIEFNIKNYLNFKSSEFYVIKAEATEYLTDLTQSTEKSIIIHENTYVVTTNLLKCCTGGSKSRSNC